MLRLLCPEGQEAQAWARASSLQQHAKQWFPKSICGRYEWSKLLEPWKWCIFQPGCKWSTKFWFSSSRRWLPEPRNAGGAHLNQVGDGYQNQGPCLQNQGLGGGPGNGYQIQGMETVPNGGYQNQINFTNQGNYQDSSPYQNHGVGGTTHSGFRHTYVSNRVAGNMPNTNANQGRELPGRDVPPDANQRLNMSISLRSYRMQ